MAAVPGPAPDDRPPRTGPGRHARRDEAHGVKAVVAALLANLLIAAAKLAGFAVTRSSSMLAEGIHSIADSGNQCLLLLGGRRSRKEADEDHPFGYGRERYFWAFIVALVLFSLGSLFAIYEGVRKIQHPHLVERPTWALSILGFALVMEALSFRTALHEADGVRGDATLRQFIRRAKIPEIPVVLLEDFAALVGLVLAAAGVVTAVLTKDGRWDGYGTVAIGALLGIVAMVLAVEMKSLLIGESASRKQVEAIRAAIEIEPDVIGLIHLRTQHLGPDELLVGAKVELLHDLTMVEVADAIDRIESNVRANVAEARVMYIEPDIHHDHRARSYVQEHGGRLDRDDPLWAEITGEHRAVEGDPPPGGG